VDDDRRRGRGRRRRRPADRDERQVREEADDDGPSVGRVDAVEPGLADRQRVVSLLAGLAVLLGRPDLPLVFEAAAGA
jgi:hypothetical protein